MTGYANAAAESVFGRIAIELKSVNSRFLDLSFRTPDSLRAVEAPAREAISATVRRGKLECRIALAQRASQDDGLRIDEAALARLASAIDAVRAQVPHTAPPTASELLRWPGVLRQSDDPTLEPESAMIDAPTTSREDVTNAAVPVLHRTVLTLLDQAIAEFDACRAREGVQMTSVIVEQLQGMRTAITALKTRVPELIAAQKQRLEDRLRDALITTGPSVPLDEILDRVRQEVAALGLRADVAEELDRLAAHIDECHRVVGAGGPAGKRLDFLAQEMNREANTIGSKSFALEQTRAAMDLKLLIEQMREQVQNIE